jgi:hypothetical protein
MLELLQETSGNLVAIRATGEITKEEYDAVMIAAVDKVAKEYTYINYLFLIETDLQNFTPAAWMRDAWMSLKNYAKWNKVAVVTDQKFAQKLTGMLSYVMPGEAKGFSFEQLEEAKAWVRQTAAAG